jgi:hypothetical protein
MSNSKKVAIIYTGLVRTIEKTMQYLRQNVLLDENRHVFAVLQSDNIEYYDKFAKESIGENLKSIEWLDNNDAAWINTREQLLLNIPIDESWKHYLRTSGSMIEYYQMYLAYQAIEKKETEENFQYDYILRTRCDIIFADPIYFNWEDYYSRERIKEFLEEIKNFGNFDSIMSGEVLTIFMNSFYNKKRMFCCESIYSLNYLYFDYNNLLKANTEDELLDALRNYLLDGKYIITIRENLVYFIKRKWFSNIPQLGITYGSHIMSNNSYWFNSESQLKQTCIESGLDVFDSTTLLEGKSLYDYCAPDYFDKNGKLIQSNDFFCFICRH